MKNKTKISFVKFFGGFLKVVEEGKLDFEKKIAILSPEKTVDIVEVQGPLFRKKGKLFYRKVVELFFIPIFFIVLFLYFSFSLLIFSEKTVFWKTLAAFPFVAVVYYILLTITSLNKRIDANESIKKYLFLFPIVSIAIAIATFQPGFYLSVLFFLSASLFLYEEFVYKDIQWIMSKKVTFWRMQDKQLFSFLIINEFIPKGENK